MKLLNLIVTLIIFATFGQVLNGQRYTLDKIVGQVGSEVVLYSEIEEQHRYEKKRFGDQPNLKCNILESSLVQKLLLTYAILDSVEVSDVQVELQLDAKMNEILQMMNNDMDRLENFYGESISQLKNRVRNRLKDQMLIQAKQAEIVNNVSITPQEVFDYFNAVPTDSLPLFNSEVELAEILVKPEVNADEKKKAYDRLAELKKRIEDGEDFAEIAKTYSDDLGSARLGGDLGMLGRGILVPEYEAAAYSLDINDLSSIVETEFGFHLIQLMDRRGNNFRTRHILIKPEITQADITATIDKMKMIRNEILVDSLDWGAAVKKYSEEQTESYNNGGRIRNPATGDTFFEISDFEDPEMFFAIDTMEVGEISQPVEFRQMTGDRIYRLINLQSRTEPHRASLELDYARIRELARRTKRNGALAEWIESKIGEVYINLEPECKSCSNMERWLQNRS